MSITSHQLAMTLSIFEREHGLTASALVLPHKASLNQMIIISNLSQSGPLTVSDLAKLTVSDKSSISRTLSGLEKLGWVTKIMSKTDHRKSLVHLTGMGSSQAIVAEEICQSLSKTMASALTVSERSQLIVLLSKIIDSLIESRKK
jgi:MarR family 2-MHQ and catechol resistance regulon transcriptional repressor